MMKILQKIALIVFLLVFFNQTMIAQNERFKALLYIILPNI